jgi:hypothetical protein
LIRSDSLTSSGSREFSITVIVLQVQYSRSVLETFSISVGQKTRWVIQTDMSATRRSNSGSGSEEDIVKKKKLLGSLERLVVPSAIAKHLRPPQEVLR